MGRSDASIARRAKKRGRTFQEQAKIDLHADHLSKRMKTGKKEEQAPKNRKPGHGAEKKNGGKKSGSREGRFKVNPGDWFCPKCGNHNRAWRIVCFAEGCDEERVVGGEKKEIASQVGKGEKKTKREGGDDGDSADRVSGGSDSDGDGDSDSDGDDSDDNDRDGDDSDGDDSDGDEAEEEKQAPEQAEGDWKCPLCHNLNCRFLAQREPKPGWQEDSN